MKKALGIVFLSASFIGLTACKKQEKELIKDDFYEPQINVPQVFLEKGTDEFKTNKELEDYLLQFPKVTFDKDHVDENLVMTIDKGDLDINSLNQEGKHEVTFTITDGDFTKSQTTIVDIVDRKVVFFEEEGKIDPFQPSMDMTADLIDYEKGFDLTYNGVRVPMNNIFIDDVTVRLAVPGVHLVKFVIKLDDGHRYYYYREVKVLDSKIPTKAEFEQYFTYDADGLACKRGVDYPTNLLVPHKYMDGDKLVTIERYNTAIGCNFRNDYGNSISNRTKFRNVETIIYDRGHQVLPTFFFALDYVNKELTKEEPTAKNTPSIKSIQLPETLISIGSGVISGTDIVDVILPRRVEKVSSNLFAMAHKVETVVFLGMPTTDDITRNFTEPGSNGAIVEKFFATDARKSVYFFVDYMLGVSEDEAKNELFRYTYQWIRKSGHIHNLNSFANYNKVLL